MWLLKPYYLDPWTLRVHNLANAAGAFISEVCVLESPLLCLGEHQHLNRLFCIIAVAQH